MAAGHITPARRIPVPAAGTDIDDVIMPMAAGDYCGPLKRYTHTKPAVFFKLPATACREARGLRHVTSPPHVFTEQPDGSLEIRESLGCSPAPGGGYLWHGYLDAGNRWREV